MALKGKARKPQPQVMMEINTTPLIDVMLVLLIMLIITIPVQLHSVDLNLPVAHNEPSPQEPLAVRIAIADTSAIRWDDEEITLERLELKLQAAAQLSQQPELHIRADRAAAYRQVVAVMAAAQRHGLARIGLVGLEQFE